MADTADRVASEMPSRPFITFDAVASETPARSATCLRVTRRALDSLDNVDPLPVLTTQNSSHRDERVQRHPRRVDDAQTFRYAAVRRCVTKVLPHFRCRYEQGAKPPGKDPAVRIASLHKLRTPVAQLRKDEHPTPPMPTSRSTPERRVPRGSRVTARRPSTLIASPCSAPFLPESRLLRIGDGIDDSPDTL